MRPIYLSIEGINSFIQKQEIDFELLSMDNIFCIYGATGSGKTTILDAIILALYGGGERGDLADYINLSCDKGEVVFVFELNQTLYKVEKRFFRKGVTKAFLSNKTTGECLAEGSDAVKKEIESLLGLTSSVFTQVVILEQGRFAKFLKADKGQRNKTVSGLFSLGRYEGLSTRFNERQKAYNQRLAILETDLAHLTYASKENLENTNKKIDEFLSVERELDRELNSIKIRLESVASAKESYNMAVSLSTSLNAFKGQIKAKSDEFKKLMDEQASLEAHKIGANEAKDLAKKCELFLSKIEHVRQGVEAVKDAENQKEKLTQRYKENDLKNKKFQDKIKGKADEFFELKSKLIKLKLLENSFDSVIKIDELLDGFNKEYIKLEREIDALESKLSERLRLNKKSQELEQFLKTNAVNLEEFKAKLIKLSLELCKKEKELLASENTLKSEQRLNLAKTLSLELNKGDDCPVCGGVFRGFKEPLNESVDFKALENSIGVLRNEIVSCSNERARLNALQETEQMARERALNEADETIKLIEAIPLSLDAELSLKRDELKAFRESVVLLSSARNNLLDSERLSAEVKTVLSEREVILAEGKGLKKRLDDFFMSARKTLEIDENINSVANIEESINRLTEQNTLILQSSLNKISFYETRIKEYNEREQRLNSELSSLKAKVEETERALSLVKDIKFDADENRRLNEQKLKLEDELKAVVSAKAVALAERERIETDIARRDKLLKEHKNVSDKRDSAAELFKLTTGDKFLEFVQEDYVEQFTFEASNRLFSLTNGKFTLEYNNNKRHGFEVKDYLRGGELRSVNTLSGGETFLASMSMAIAISRLLAAKQKFDFFFLDEGFGTLDEDAIEVAADALFTLSSDTLVGLVTHRKELVERIPKKLLVTAASEERGTEILY